MYVYVTSMLIINVHLTYAHKARVCTILSWYISCREYLYTHTYHTRVHVLSCIMAFSMFVLATLVTLGQRLSTRFQCLRALLYGFAENTNAVKQAWPQLAGTVAGKQFWSLQDLAENWLYHFNFLTNSIIFIWSILCLRVKVLLVLAQLSKFNK